MNSADRLLQSVDRFQQAFWARNQSARPPVAVSPSRNWMPIHYLREPLARPFIVPGDVTRVLTRTECEDTALDRTDLCDDWIPYAAIWRGVPWLEAICGCPIRVTEAALAPAHYVASPELLAETVLPADPVWLAKYESRTRELVDESPEGCWISPTILRGAADVLNAMRGSDFFLDLVDAPTAIAEAADRINNLLIDVLLRHFSLVTPKLGGYGSFYGYWAPGPTVVIQEDAMGLCAPRLYRELFFDLNAATVSRLGPNVFFHLHATGYKHARHVLDIPGLAGLELTVEQNGPGLAELEPFLRDVLGRTRLILFVDAHFDELAEVLRRLPSDGLYLLISEQFIPDDESLLEFLHASYLGQGKSKKEAPGN